MRRYAGVVAVGIAAVVAAMFAASARPAAHATPLSKIDHFVVIYEENHSFDNLYGGWEAVNGRANADAAHTTQIGQAGAAPPPFFQKDSQLASPPPAGGLTHAPAPTNLPPPLFHKALRNQQDT